MNILFFNRSFYPDTEATGQFLTELCEDLSKFGHNITVIAGRSYYKSNQKFFLLKKEKYKSIEIIRACGTVFPKRFLILRIINLATYFLSAFVGGFTVKEKPNVIIALTDPPVLGLLGYFFSKWYKAKFVYSCKDIYPDIGIVTGKLKNPFINWLLKKINYFSFQSSAKVICLGEDMKKTIIKKGVNENKIEVIHDWADTDMLCPVPPSKNPFRIKHNMQNYFTLMYSGNIGLSQELDKLIDVAERLKENKKIRFFLIGEGADKKRLQKLVLDKILENVIFLPYQPYEELKYSLSASDIHMITLQKGLAGLVVPSKIYGVMACGKPFIALIDEESEIGNIVKQFNCGVVIPPGDIRNMIGAIKQVFDHPEMLVEMGVQGRKVAEKYFDREISSKKFESVISTL